MVHVHVSVAWEMLKDLLHRLFLTLQIDPYTSNLN